MFVVAVLSTADTVDSDIAADSVANTAASTRVNSAVLLSTLDDTDDTPTAATAALPMSAGVTDTSPVSLSATVADQLATADGPVTCAPGGPGSTTCSPHTGVPGSPQTGVPGSPHAGVPGSPQTGVLGSPHIGVPGSPHTATSSISSPSEVSADVIDENADSATANTTTTIPLVRTPGMADATLHIKPRPLDTDDLVRAAVTHADTVSHADTVTVSQLSPVSQNGDSKLADDDVKLSVAAEPAATSLTVSAAALDETVSETVATLNETTTETISDEVRFCLSITACNLVLSW